MQGGGERGGENENQSNVVDRGRWSTGKRRKESSEIVLVMERWKVDGRREETHQSKKKCPSESHFVLCRAIMYACGYVTFFCFSSSLSTGTCLDKMALA